MRTLLLSVLIGSLAIGSYGKPVELLKPAQDSTVPLLTDEQKSYLQMPLSERREKFANPKFRNKMGMPPEIVDGKPRKPYWPRTVEFSWRGDIALTYSFVLRIKGNDKPVCQEAVKGCSFRLDNLEIAREYEWEVERDGEKATGTFKTEDRAPRLLRFPGVPNVRDLGGRIGRDGRRVKQGLVFRSAGLNANAKTVYYTTDELRAMGKLETLDKEAREAQARLEQLEGWRKNITFFDRNDPEYVEWSKRHPKDPPSVFLKSRIKRAQETLKKGKDVKVAKEKVPGQVRFSEEEGAWLLKSFGIKTDIDLRSDSECFGMTGSPLGPSVTWRQISSSAYSGLQADSGRSSFRKVFKVFLDEKNYPIDFHCIAGQDRTGSVAFILGALLGVETNELYLDWEVTGFWNHEIKLNHKERFDHLVDGFKKNFPAPTIQESVEKYVLSLGFSEKEIDTFHEFMLEPK